MCAHTFLVLSCADTCSVLYIWAMCAIISVANWNRTYNPRDFSFSRACAGKTLRRRRVAFALWLCDKVAEWDVLYRLRWCTVCFVCGPVDNVIAADACLRVARMCVFCVCVVCMFCWRDRNDSDGDIHKTTPARERSGTIISISNIVCSILFTVNILQHYKTNHICVFDIRNWGSM